ncbi:peptidase M52 [Actinoplanes sp. ATCC 53533]|uniref:hydrogenase maturation protease n=1 Tax=Actinoplanes sp. ATCC 53533 TaxID=1288362 RepID=UPI000F78ADB4|nr:hydrogenase maturation protease [Actinoplanes sp. ATCC 53533]RSM54857.1 peptidase M52 [Actinoplanes sp. ATCC 53533]
MTEAAGVLVAGIGNLFLGDDGFGPEVVRRLAGRHPLPPGVRVADYGIRGMHLAYDLLAPCAALVLVDALPGGVPGEIVVLEVSSGDLSGADLGGGEFDGHGMSPVAMLAGVERLGGTLPPTYVVGCRAGAVAEGIGLSPPVAAAVPGAIAAVLALVHRLTAAEPARTRRS